MYKGCGIEEGTGIGNTWTSQECDRLDGQKWGVPGREEMWGRTGRTREGESNQDILYEKRSYFQYREENRRKKTYSDTTFIL